MAMTPFDTEPAGYTKGAWSDLQGAWQNLRESVATTHPFTDSARLLFHIDEAMSWESVRNLDSMRKALTLVENIARRAAVPDEIAENVEIVRACFQELLDAIAEGKA
jgi:hypothetical protein